MNDSFDLTLRRFFRQLMPRILGIFLLLFISTSIKAQNISFSKSNLDFNGKGSVSQGTFIQFGPDGKLYVMELKGLIKVFDVQKVGPNNYKVTSAQTINAVKDLDNHNDNGSFNSGNNREATALLVTGTASNPVLYVSSSDWRIGGPSGDKNLDTNSGVITRLTWNGSSWDVVDIIRGLPRSEENHATHGLEYAVVGGKPYLLVCQGGHTNAGSPSKNFAWHTEYALSGAILAVDINQINGMSTFTDAGRTVVYDIPTLDDPTRNNVNGITDPNAPGYDGIDVNDPWGGNDGLNQAKLVPNGPIEIFSPGYRNSYDITVTQSGAVYVTDNGANGGWGGFPENEGPGGNVTNDYRPGEPGSNSTDGGEAKVNNKDHLTMITNDIQNYTFGSFYGGHPNPVRANPSGAGLFTRGSHSSDPGDSNGNGYTDDWFRNSILNTNNANFSDRSLPVDWPPVPLNMANPIEGDFRNPGGTNPDGPNDVIVTTLQNNSNGIDEYTASNFGGAMQGDLIIGRSSNLHRVTLNANGSLNTKTHNWTSGLGGNALGVTCNSDTDPFPGTIWVATYNSDIVILEPNDAVSCLNPGDPGYDPNDDYDSDGFTNQDEEDNGTDMCSGSSQPSDFDGDNISDLNDLDDDGDGIPDASDPFQMGAPFDLPVINELFSDQPQWGGYLGLGFTGLMNNGDPNPNYLNWLDDPNASNTDIDDIYGGAIGAVTIYQTSGDATTNDQEKAFQYGVNMDSNNDTIVVSGRMLQGFQNHLPGQSQALFMGTGFQDDYIKLMLVGNSLSVEGENGGVSLTGLPSTTIGTITGNLDLSFYIEPSTGQIQAVYSLDNGTTINFVGSPFAATGAVLTAIQNASSPLAVGVMGTSGAHPEYAANWDFLNVFEKNGTIVPITINVNPISNQNNLEGDNINLQVNASGGNGALIYSASGLPAGLSINTSSGLISGTISTGAAGPSPYSVTITVDDSDSDNTDIESETFDWIVTTPVTGGPTDIWLEAECATVGAQWTEVSDGSASNGKYLNPPVAGSNGAASTNPDDMISFNFSVPQAGTYKVFARVQATSGTADSYWVRANGGAWQKWNKINAGNYGINFLWSQVGNWTSGPSATPVTFNLVAGANTIDFSRREKNTNLDKIYVTLTGSLPTGNGASSSNCVQGTPIVVTPIADQANNEGDNANVTVMATGGDGNLNFVASNLPTGVTIDPTNGLIGGTIDAGASVYSPYPVTITIDDSDADNTDIQVISFNWTITDSNAPIPIILSTIANQLSSEGDNANLQVNASGGNGALSYQATGLPTGLSIDNGTGLISGTVSAGAFAGSPYAVTIMVDDSDTTSSDQETANFTWTINDPNAPIAIVANPIGNQQSLEGDIISLQVAASGGNGALQYAATGLPAGLSINPASGLISGTLASGTAVGSPYAVSVDIDDSDSDNTDIQTINFNWQVDTVSTAVTDVWLEAECATVGAQWTEVSDGSASNSKYLNPPNAGSNTTPSTNPADMISFNFNVSQAGAYKVFARIQATSGTADSYWVRANGGTWQRWNKINAGSYGINFQWSQVGNWISGGSAVPVTFNLVSGANTIDFSRREKNTNLDKIFVTLNGSIPTGTGDPSSNCSLEIPINLTNISSQDDFEGDNINLQVSASGGDGPLSYQATGLPTGLSINSSNGLISGIISSGAAALSPFAVTVTVDDNDTTTSDAQSTSFNWTVTDPNAPIAIVLNGISNQLSSEGGVASLQVSASGGNGALNYQASGLPAGLSINASTGLISGTIAAGAYSGSPYSVSVTVDDSDLDNTDIQTTGFTWTINDPNSPIPIVVTSIGNRQNDEGDNVSYQVVASGGNGALNYQASGLPAGLAIDSGTGLISGTVASGAAAISPFSVSITVDDSDGDNTDIQVVNFMWEIFLPTVNVTDVWLEAECATIGSQWTEVADASASNGKYVNPPNAGSNTTPSTNPADMITFSFDVSQAGAYKVFALIQATSGTADSYWVRANGGTWQRWNKINAGSYSINFQWSQVGNWISGGSAVPVTFNLVAGTNTIDFSRREKNTNLDKIFITLNGSLPTGTGSTASNCDPGTPIQLTALSNRQDFEGDIISLQVNATGGDGTLNYQASGLPTGLSINAGTGLISGTIAAGASTSSPFSVIVTIDDSDADAGDVQMTSFNWDVYDPTVGVPIVLNTIGNQSNFEGTSPSLQVNASGGDGALSYQATGLPGGLSMNPSTGLISGTINTGTITGSPYSVTVTVDDSDAFSTDAQSTSFNWVVDTISSTVPDSWTKINNTHIERSENSMVQAGDKFYLFGGRQSPQVLEIYDYASNTWTTGASAPEQFNHFQATEFDGLIWVICAFDKNTFPNETPEDKIHIYDPANDEWIVGATIPSGRRRGSAGLVVYNDKFYAVGGNTIGHNGGYINWFDEYDPINNSWTQLTNAPRARDHFHAAIIGTKLYAAGGRLSGGTGGTFAPTISEVDVYDFSSNSWSTLPGSQDLPTPRAGTATVNFKDKLVVIGGEGNGQAYDDAESYDPATSSWTALSKMNHARHGTQAISSGDGIFITAGSHKQGGGKQTNMEVYGINNPAGSPSVAGTLTTPNSVNIVQNNAGNIILQHTGGNVGIYIRSLQIQNVSGGSFTITNGDPGAGGFLLKSGSSHAVEVSLGGGTAGQTANLVINYGKNSSKTVTINGVASSSPSRQAAGNADALNRSLIIYPNPTSGQPQLNVSLKLAEADKVDFNLLDITGKRVFSMKEEWVKPESLTKIPVTGLAKGVYILQVNGQTWQEYKRVTID